MDTDFAIYVSSTEWIEMRSVSFLTIKGSQCSAPLRGKDVLALCLSTRETLRIDGETLPPSRPGIRGKMLSHILREGTWTSKQKPRQSIDESFLVPADSRLGVHRLSVQVRSCQLECESQPFIPVGYPIPIETTQPGMFGVLLLVSELRGELQLLSEQRPALQSPVVSLTLVNRSIRQGVAFEVEVIQVG